MNYYLKNKTGYEIEFNNKIIKNNDAIELNELPELNEVICYSDGDCNLYYNNGYKTNDNIHVLEIYIG
jgi:hypothetical protein